MPGPRIINVHCQKCKTHLMKYRKDIPGHLIKLYQHEIIENHTRGDLRCHKCEQVFARPTTMIHGKPAHKVIQGKVYVK